MIANFDSAKFAKEMDNLMKYSIGYLEGIQAGKQVMLRNLGMSIKEVLESYVDANARANPELLHHVYEWSMTGSPSARLFDIRFTVSNLGLSFMSEFSQSTSIKEGSRVPFAEKAKVMESGASVIITPRASQVLAFEDDGQTVFTRSPVRVDSPGGSQTTKGFEKTFDSFFNQYFTQSFLRASGIGDYLRNPISYKKNLASGKRGGRATGYSTGYRWIANVGVE